jgi:hypothetical protein
MTPEHLSTAAARDTAYWAPIERALSEPVARGVRSEPDQTQAEKRIRTAFGAARRSFADATRALRLTTKLFVVCSGVTVTASVAGLFVISALHEAPTGAALSMSGILGTIACFWRVQRLAKDTALFEFLIAKYELALSLAATERQYEHILNEFIVETTTLRRTEPRRAAGGKGEAE